MKRAYQDGGYYRVRVQACGSSEGDPRRVRYTIDEGRPYEVRQLRFVGNEQLVVG